VTETSKEASPDLGEPSVRLLTLAAGVRAAFTGRRGGLSEPPYDSLNMGSGSGDSPGVVARNRALVAAACGLDQDRLIWMRQVHSADVAHVTAPDGTEPAGTVPGGTGPAGTGPGETGPGEVGPGEPRDASFTSVPGLGLGVLSADCPAVLVADPDTGIVGVAHSGRVGMAAGVVPALVRAMAAAGADPAAMCAVIGPAICGQCYEVPAAMREEVGAMVPGSACLTRIGTPGLDLHAGISGQLASLGVRRVQRDERCTAEDDDLYSYRRDGRTGRFAGLIWLTP
jgi:polyphenol oxidase